MTEINLVRLKRIPFAVDSIADLLERGSMKRELAERAADCIRHDVELIVAELRDEKKSM